MKMNRGGNASSSNRCDNHVQRMPMRAHHLPSYRTRGSAPQQPLLGRKTPLQLPAARAKVGTWRAAAAAAVAPAAEPLPPSSSSPFATPPPSLGPQELDLPKHWQDQLSKAPVGKRRVLQRYCALVREINLVEPLMMALSNEELQAKTGELKARLAGGEVLDNLLVEAFAVVREASRRVLGLRHFDSQLLGGMVLHEGQIAEMQTGEGKTLMATLPVYLNALTGRGVHVVTVNDYLAARDVGWMGKLYRFLGLTCAAVQSNMSTEEYQHAYGCDITYVTGQELCFDYLRDNTEKNPGALIMPSELHFAVVDEVDSILIDESRNPMIVSVPVSSSPEVVKIVDQAVKMMYAKIEESCKATRKQLVSTQHEGQQIEALYRGKYKQHYMTLDLKQKSISLTNTGITFLVNALKQLGVVFVGDDNDQLNEAALWQQEIPWGQMCVTAIRAHEFYTNGVEYIVRDGKVYIIDESTGRVRMSSRYNGGMHQAIEAKEGAEVQHESVASSSITFQVFFRFYEKLAGMTGTAQTAAAELYEIYKLRVVQIPTAKPCIRQDRPPRLYIRKDEKFRDLVELIEQCWMANRPVLIGTTSVNESEEVKQALRYFSSMQSCVETKVQVLNAKPENVRTEAETIAQAGLPGQVTIATNMAGRGTDIILGGNPKGLTKLGLIRLLYKQLLEDPAEVECIPRMPLPEFSIYDTSQPLAPLEWSEEGHAAGRMLPRDLHFVLYQAMLMGGVAKASATPEQCTFDGIQKEAEGAMDLAEQLKMEVGVRLRGAHPGSKLEDLDYSRVVCPVAKEVLVDLEGLYLEESPGQRLAVKAALYLWLWMDQKCAAFARTVKSVKGLLVIGTSVQESQRIELQLRGRAGRQGDPGETWMIYDITDPLLTMMGALQQLVTVPGVTIDQFVVDRTVRNTQRVIENIYQMARLETKQYDEIMEGYRHNLYTLRRTILLGSQQQRTQLIYLFFQRWLDALVAKKLDPNQPPSAWLRQVPVKGSDGKEVMSSPLEDVLRAVQQLVNPEGVVSKTLLEFRTVDQDGTVKNSTAANLMKLMGMGQKRGSKGLPGGDANGDGIPGLSGAEEMGGGNGPPGELPRLPVQILEIEVLSPDQIASLARYLLQDSDLEWVRPRVPITLSFKTAVSRHRHLVGSVRRGGEKGGAAELLDSSLRGLAQSASRPVVQGRYADKVEVLRDYLGESLIYAYELRKLSLRKALMSQQVGMLDMDADIHLSMYEQRLTLEWMDALWSAFLEDMDRVKRAVQVKSFGNLSPLEEFRLEANRTFLAMLDMFREAVVEKLFAPSFEMEFLFEDWD